MTALSGCSSPDISIVLPPSESFSPRCSGAIALVVHAAMKAPSRYQRLVLGPDCLEPFHDVAFAPVPLAFGLGSANHRYATAIARRSVGPMIEVHNRPAVALRLASMLPAAQVSLFLHNDPRTMRGFRSALKRQRASRKLAGIVCVSDYIAERFAEGCGSCPITIPNGMDLSGAPHIASRDKLILFAGRVVADKGADVFIAACRQALADLPGWRAEMIGADRFSANSPDTDFTRHLAPQAAAANVVLRGYQPHAAVMAAMSRASIVVVPSRWAEPFGMVALEAMACGAALVCSLRGALKEVVGDVAVSCEPDDAANVAAAIRTLARDPTEIARRGIAGLARAALFDVGQIARQLDDYRDELKTAAARDHMPP